MKLTKTKNSTTYGTDKVHIKWTCYTYDGVNKKKLYIKFYFMEVHFEWSDSKK